MRSRFFKIISTLNLFGSLFVLTGCGDDLGDLEGYAKEVLARPGGRMEPLPEFKAYEAYFYQSAESNARDPFELFYQQQAAPQSIANEDIGLSEEMENEIKHRNKEELEEFELDSLRMVGTMDNEEHQWGIIKDPNGVVHIVEVGNYLGRNTGKILGVFENKIEIREIIKDSRGRWEERQAEIALDEE